MSGVATVYYDGEKLGRTQGSTPGVSTIIFHSSVSHFQGKSPVPLLWQGLHCCHSLALDCPPFPLVASYSGHQVDTRRAAC